MRGYSRCKGNPTNQCVYARKCPYHGDAKACAEDQRAGLGKAAAAAKRRGGAA